MGKSGRKMWVVIGLLLLLGQGAISRAEPVGTGFMYQGSIMDGDQPAEGLYDFQFKLFDAPTDGNQVGRTVDVNGVDVSDGCFAVELDFVPDEPDSLQPQGLKYDKVFGLDYQKIWGGGEARWLEIGFRWAEPVQTLAAEAAASTPYSVLVPRRKITPVPYALHALSSGGSAGDEGGLYDVLRRSSSWGLALGETAKPPGDAGGQDLFNVGRLGLGTTSPAYPLDVAGAANLNKGKTGIALTVNGSEALWFNGT